MKRLITVLILAVPLLVAAAKETQKEPITYMHHVGILNKEKLLILSDPTNKKCDAILINEFNDIVKNNLGDLFVPSLDPVCQQFTSIDEYNVSLDRLTKLVKKYNFKVLKLKWKEKHETTLSK
jgi:hypothetical protein